MQIEFNNFFTVVESTDELQRPTSDVATFTG